MPYLPPDFIKTTVLIAEGNKVVGTDRVGFKPLGTGFLVQPKNRFYLLTANHVVKSRYDLWYCFTAKDGKIIGIEFKFVKDKFGVDWNSFPQYDLAIITVAFDEKRDDVRTLPLDFLMPSDEVSPGEDVYFLGYPLGLVDPDDITPFVRKGMIARKSKIQKKLIIDGYSTGGSSGSPVFLKPQQFTPGGGLRIGGFAKKPSCIGMIQSHISHPDNPDENTNLCNALPSEYILKALESIGALLDT